MVYCGSKLVTSSSIAQARSGSQSPSHSVQQFSFCRRDDRVELTGLRPPALPHHRTCCFQHTAVETQPPSYMVAARSDGMTKP
jgi:hypothetical protein